MNGTELRNQVRIIDGDQGAGRLAAQVLHQGLVGELALPGISIVGQGQILHIIGKARRPDLGIRQVVQEEMVEKHIDFVPLFPAGLDGTGVALLVNRNIDGQMTGRFHRGLFRGRFHRPDFVAAGRQKGQTA